ncbi:MAG: DUF4296 domain-containing protein [Bacteroidia bacterium]|nr:DUF4296 domain-containing protein [Bacteroidia bacterium]
MNSESIIRVLLFCCLAYACGREQAIPPGVLTKEEMVPLLTDIQLAQAEISLSQQADPENHSLSDYLITILKHRKISVETYEKSIRFYSEHPGLLNEVYQAVIIRLNQLQGEVQAAG